MTKQEFKTLFDIALSAPAQTLRAAYDIQPIVDKAMMLGNQMREDHVLMALAPEEAAIINDMRRSMKEAAEKAAAQAVSQVQPSKE